MRKRIARLKEDEFTRVFLLRAIGNFLLLSSIFMIAKTFAKPVYEEARYLVNKTTGKQYVVADSKQQKGALAQAIKEGNVEILNPVDPDYSIVIPKIGANARVL